VNDETKNEAARRHRRNKKRSGTAAPTKSSTHDCNAETFFLSFLKVWMAWIELWARGPKVQGVESPTFMARPLSSRSARHRTPRRTVRTALATSSFSAHMILQPYGRMSTSSSSRSGRAGKGRPRRPSLALEGSLNHELLPSLEAIADVVPTLGKRQSDSLPATVALMHRSARTRDPTPIVGV